MSHKTKQNKIRGGGFLEAQYGNALVIKSAHPRQQHRNPNMLRVTLDRPPQYKNLNIISARNLIA